MVVRRIVFSLFFRLLPPTASWSLRARTDGEPLRGIVVGCLQRLGSAAASCAVPTLCLMSLDGGGGRFFLIFWRSTRI